MTLGLAAHAGLGGQAGPFAMFAHPPSGSAVQRLLSTASFLLPASQKSKRNGTERESGGVVWCETETV